MIIMIIDNRFFPQLEKKTRITLETFGSLTYNNIHLFTDLSKMCINNLHLQQS